MEAGRSAVEQAKRAQAASDALRRKADYADRVAANYTKGAVGETAVASALASLAASGWLVMHDRVHPGGGNIDHIAIGPPGVAVIDAKNWSDPVTISGTQLRSGTRSQTKSLRHLAELVGAVKAAISSGSEEVPVRGYIALTGQADRERANATLGELRVIGIDCLAARLAGAPGTLGVGQIEAVFRTCRVHFPRRVRRHRRSRLPTHRRPRNQSPATRSSRSATASTI